MKRDLTALEIEVMRQLDSDWRSLKTIVWEFNGPRELALQMSQIQEILNCLTKAKILESKTGKTRLNCNIWGDAETNKFYRRCAA